VQKQGGDKSSMLSRHLSKLGSKGGLARTETMTKKQLKQAASNAANQRWNKDA
jgi:hypothetical protein